MRELVAHGLDRRIFRRERDIPLDGDALGPHAGDERAGLAARVGLDLREVTELGLHL